MFKDFKMKKKLLKYVKKLFFKQWIIGICKDNIDTILKNKNFDADIKWLKTKSLEKFYADPFLVNSKENNIKILFEEYKFNEEYGKISLLTLNNNFKKINSKTLLDTQVHLSYPFVFVDNDKIYIFPESAQNGKLSCYEYDEINERINFIKDIFHIPLLDATILKYNNKYWIFGTLGSNNSNYSLNIYYSDNLFGPYNAHEGNPVKTGLDGIRPAGNFIQNSGNIFRPTQNCKNKYGESITINKLMLLNEKEFSEELYMKVEINNANKCNKGIHSIHTFNIKNELIVIDGQRWVFSPIKQLKKYRKGKLINKIAD